MFGACEGARDDVGAGDFVGTFVIASMQIVNPVPEMTDSISKVKVVSFVTGRWSGPVSLK